MHWTCPQTTMIALLCFASLVVSTLGKYFCFNFQIHVSLYIKSAKNLRFYLPQIFFAEWYFLDFLETSTNYKIWIFVFRQEVTHLVTILGAPARTTTFTVLGDTCPVSVPGGHIVDAVPHILLQVWPLSTIKTKLLINIWYKTHWLWIDIFSFNEYSLVSLFLTVVKETISMSELVGYNTINTNCFRV